jgi:hypothetical protein
LIFTDPVVEGIVRFSHSTLYILEALGAVLVVVLGKFYLKCKRDGTRKQEAAAD